VEAGTGTGKTLGYLAPASLWAEKNGPGLWISTYTRNLQRQIVQEIAHLWPDPVERAELSSALFDHVASGRIKIEINQRYGLDEAARAHWDLEAGRTTGSSIFVV